MSIDFKLAEWFKNDMSNALLRTINLSSGMIRGLKAFQINFDFPIAVIAGGNGSGKTTLLALAACAFHNKEDGFKLNGRKLPYYTLSDFIIQSADEISPNGINVTYGIAHNNWLVSKNNIAKVGVLYQALTKIKGGKWRTYENRVRRNVVFFGIDRVVPHSEKSVSKSYRSSFKKTINGCEEQVRHSVGKVLNKGYEEFHFRSHSKYRLPFVKVMVKNTYDATTANLLTISNFGLLKETRAYNTNGTLLTSKDGLNQTTTYGSYKLGIPQLTTYADAKTTSAVVNALGWVTSTTNEVAATSSYGYDAMGRLSSITHPAGDSVAWNATTIQFEKVATAEYGIAGDHWRTTVTTGDAKRITYLDALWRPVLSRTYDVADEGATRTMVLRRFDYNGATTFESYPQRTISAVTDTVNGTTYTLDALGRATKIAVDSELGVLNTVTAYNTGFKKIVTNARGFETTYGYQAFDTPSEEALTSIVQPYGFTTTISRDVFGKTTSIYKYDVNDNATRSYVYDANARLCKTIEPEIGATVLNYDAASNIAWRAIGVALPSTTTCDQASVATAKKISYGYDARNRLTATTYGDTSPSISRTLFGDGLPQTVSSNGTVWTYTYNKRRLLETESLAYAGKTYNIGRSYDVNGAPATLSYPGANAFVLNFVPNALGQARNIGGYAYNITYSPNGALNFFNYGSGMLHSRLETIRGMTYRVRDEGVMFDEYTYDANGNVTGVTDLQEGVTTRTMGYDAVDRLQTATANGAGMWGTASYLSDALDNIRTINVTSGVNTRNISLNYDASKRLASISGTTALSLGYDTQGNLTSRGTAAYVFDQGNRMSSATGKASYVYDGWGRRVKMAKTDGTTVIQVYSMDGQLLYGSTAVGAATPAESRYVYLNGHMLGEEGVAYVHTDGLGSPIARTNAAGTLLTRTRYEPYGLTAAGTAPTTIGFTGHVNDTDTALVYMQQRYYDPVVGRFMSTDPVLTDAGTGGSFNRYNYANNSPYKFIDQDGRAAASIEACLGKCLGLTVGYSFKTTEMALTANYGNGIGGGAIIDFRANENGRANSSDDSRGNGVVVDAYAKAGAEVSLGGITLAEGGKAVAGFDSGTGTGFASSSKEQGVSRGGKIGLSVVAAIGVEASAYLNISDTASTVANGISSAISSIKQNIIAPVLEKMELKNDTRQ